MNQKQLDKKLEIHCKFSEANETAIALAKRILATLEKESDIEAEEINWGDVGTSQHQRNQLQEISDGMHNEGEFAE